MALALKPVHYRLLILALLSGLTMSPSGLSAQEEGLSATEYQIKAAYLYNFAKFVEWPADAFHNSSDSFVIGLMGEDPFGHDLEEVLAGKAVQDKKIVLVTVSSMEQARNCQVLFISPSEEAKLKSIERSLSGQPVLLVSDMEGFIERGGMIGLTMEGKKIRFSINKDASDAAKLKLSSQLLKLAKVVK